MNYKYKKELNNVLKTLFNFYLIYFGLGIIFGYNENIYSLKIINILKNILVPFLSIILLESIRAIFINKKTKEINIIIVTILLILIECIFKFHLFSFSNVFEIIKTIVRYIIPIISNNILLSYINKKYDFKLSFFYSIIIKLYMYFIVVIPNVSDYIYGIMMFLLSYFIYMEIDKDDEKVNFTFIEKTILILYISLIILYSGLMKVMLVPVYESKVDNILKSDATLIITEKVKEKDTIVYNNNNRYIVSKIDKIEDIDGEILYYVDTDFENEYALVKDSNLVGKVVNNIPFAGYAPVLVHDIEEIIVEIYKNHQ